MKDPCDECIIKVNCTEVCPEKSNYKALIQHAIDQRKGITGRLRYFKENVNYTQMLVKTRLSENQIYHRSMLKEKGN